MVEEFFEFVVYFFFDFFLGFFFGGVFYYFFGGVVFCVDVQFFFEFVFGCVGGGLLGDFGEVFFVWVVLFGWVVCQVVLVVQWLGYVFQVFVVVQFW